MAETKLKRALIAVYDKTGVADFARTLVDEFGIEILSTGGTARHLQEAGIPVTLVEQVTAFPEMLDGRVKTLHPKIHAAILADRDKPEHMRQLAEQGIEPIDMVVVNLYPFEETIAKPDCKFEDAIEMIDIGGPCLLRAAAKNHKHVLPVMTRRQFPDVLTFLRKFLQKAWAPHLPRLEYALRAFGAIASYDRHVSQYLAAHWLTSECSHSEVDVEAMRHPMTLPDLCHPRGLRYGENPHQRAQGAIGDSGIDGVGSGLVSYAPGTVPSYNNWVDASAALDLCRELTRGLSWLCGEGRSHRARTSVVAFIKHTNACGCGIAAEPLDAYRRAYLGDPNAAMGGILACNFHISSEFAAAAMETYDRWGKAAGAGGFFVEVWVAPTFDGQAVEIIRTRKEWGERVRVLPVGDMHAVPDPDKPEFRSIAGGVLMQTRDLIGLNEEQWEAVTERKPTEAEMDDLRLAWLVCKHTKSNAITICRDGMLIGNGAGQMSRVMSCRIAVWAVQENGHLIRDAGTQGRRDEGAQHSALGTQHSASPVAASDAFFPFRDGPDLLLDAGVTAIIQPGGSKRDAEVIAACNARGAAMLFTHTRHFKH